MQRNWLRRCLLLAALAAVLCVLTLSAAALDTPAIGIGIVTTENGLFVRSEPSTSGAIIAAASGEDALVVLSKEGDWYHVLYNLDEGYVHSDYVQFKERENVELGAGIIIEPKVNLRTGPGTGNGIAASMSKDETARIIGFNCGWYKVIYNNITGYVRSDLMDLTEKPLTNSDGFGYRAMAAAPAVAQAPAEGQPAPVVQAPVVSQTPTVISGDAPAPYVPNSTAADLANYAQQLQGCPYVYGGSSPSGFDCSGFVQYVYRQYGYSLNRTANDQMKNGNPVDFADLQPGDIVFFGYNGYSNHSGIYIGNNQFVHAANPDSGVVITSLSSDYYSSTYLGARRIIN